MTDAEIKKFIEGLIQGAKQDQKRCKGPPFLVEFYDKEVVALERLLAYAVHRGFGDTTGGFE